MSVRPPATDLPQTGAAAAPAAPPRAQPRAGWAQRAERSNMLMLRIMTWISLRLGRRVARVVLAGIALYFLLFAPSARRASRQYLARALGRPARWADGFRQVFSFASTIHDRIYLLNDRFDLFDIRLHGQDVIEAALQRKEGVFMVGAHFGSFEMTRAVSRHIPELRVYMAMYSDNAQKIRSALAAINPSAMQNIIDLAGIDSLLAAHLHLSEGAVVGMLADRTIRSDDCVPIGFLGEPAPFPTGPFRFAALLRRPIYFMVGSYRGKNRYTIHFERLTDPSLAPQDRQAHVAQIRRDYVAALERHCRSAPYNWFNFYDFWKLPARNS